MKRAHAVLIAAFLSAVPLLLSFAPAFADTQCSFTADLHVGSRGASVTCLQDSLIGNGYAIPAGATGYFGSQTRRAVSLWQKEEHVSPSAGYFGPISRRTFVSGTLSGSVAQYSTAVPTAPAASPVPAPAPESIVPQFAAVAGGGGAGAATPVPQPVPPVPSAPPISVPVSVPAPVAAAQIAAPATTTPLHSEEIFGTLSTATVNAIAPVPSAAPAGSILWSCDFENGYCGMYEQSALEPDGHRSFFTTPARTGVQAIELMTQPGDSNIHGSGAWERDDLELAPSSDYCNEGQEEWWATSVYFPSDYVMPQQGMEVMDFHDNNSGGQANLNFVSDPDQLRIVGYGGDFNNPTKYSVDLGSLVKNQWYDLVYHMKWSSNTDGFMTAWINGKKVLDYHGPTLYKGISCYFKLADYHDALGVPEPVIFDHVVRGTSASAVALEPLQ